MPPSEIDDIFASRGKHSASSALPGKKKKDKARGKAVKGNANVPGKVPETVFDPSAALPSAKKRKHHHAEQPAASAAKAKRPKKDREEEDRFKDSRGSGSRRRTDEGYLIYKEAELGMKDDGGDTPLCPFDCQCCF